MMWWHWVLGGLLGLLMLVVVVGVFIGAVRDVRGKK